MILRIKSNLEKRDFNGALKAIKAVEGAQYNASNKTWSLPVGWEKTAQPNVFGGIHGNVKCGDVELISGYAVYRDGDTIGEVPAPVAESAIAPVVEATDYEAYEVKLFTLDIEAQGADGDARAEINRWHERGDSDKGYRLAERHEARAEAARAARKALIIANPVFEAERQARIAAARAEREANSAEQSARFMAN